MFIKDFGPLVSYLLGGLRLFGALGSYSCWGLIGSLKTWCCVHKTCRFLKVRNCFGPEVLLFWVSCVKNFLVVSGSYKFWVLRFMFFVGPYINIFVVLHKTFGVLCSRAQGPLLLMKQKL